MNILKPSENNFTIYSKSDCIYFTNIDELMQTNFCEYTKIICDDYVNDKFVRKEFSKFMKQFMEQSPKTFPIVFYNGKYVGGFQETEELLKYKTMRFDEEF